MDTPRSPPVRSHLPRDITLNVIFELDSERRNSSTPWFHTGTILQPTLLALSMTDRGWNDIAVRLLYKDVFLGGSDRLSRFSCTLQEREDLRDYVQSFSFTRSPDEDGEEWSSLDNARDIQNIYSICHNLRSERLMHTSQRLQPSNIHMREGRWKELGADRITCLELRSFDRLVVELFRSDPTFAVLEELIIRDAQLSGTGIPAFRWPTMPQLRRLCLHQCVFEDKCISLPSKLRALEIIGGSYMVDNLEDEIISAGNFLELLTFIPIFFTSTRHDDSWNNWLRELPYVVTLRITASSFIPSSIELPPRLQHLLVVRMAWNFDDGLPGALGWLERQIDFRRSGSISSLLTVRLVGPEGSSVAVGKKEIERAAMEVGIRYSIVLTKKHIYVEGFLKG